MKEKTCDPGFTVSDVRSLIRRENKQAFEGGFQVDKVYLLLDDESSFDVGNGNDLEYYLGKFVAYMDQGSEHTTYIPSYRIRGMRFEYNN